MQTSRLRCAGSAWPPLALFPFLAVPAFLFFGSVGVGGNYGPVTQALAVLSIAMLFPLSIVWLWHRCVEARA